MTSPRPELLAALRTSKEALAAFQAMPPSHQERWVAHIAEAKKPETRARRIQKCLQELSGASPRRAEAGYSGTPLLQKLGIKEGHRVALLGMPENVPAALASVKASASSSLQGGRSSFDVIVLFADRRSRLETMFKAAARALAPAGGLWVAWPKRASGVPADLTEDVVREIALASGLVDNKVCAIDEVWSGLRCVYRLEDRPASR